MKTTLVLLLGLPLIFSACGQDSSSKNPNARTNSKTENFTYQYSENNCDTGTHQFTTRTDLCHALQSEELNHGCALDMRQDDFKNSCPGETFTPIPVPPGDRIQLPPPPVEVPPGAPTAITNGALPKSAEARTELADTKLSLYRADKYDGDNCDKTVFSGKFKEFFPQFAITGLSAVVYPVPAFDENGELRAQVMVGGLEISNVNIFGKKDQLRRIHMAINTQQPEIKLTESSYCAAKNEDMILVELVNAPDFDKRKIMLDAQLKILESKNGKCEIAKMVSIREMVLAKNPKADLTKGVIEYTALPFGRKSDSGDLVTTSLIVSYTEAGSKLEIWNAKISSQVKSSLLDSLASGNSIFVTNSEACKRERLDDPILVK